MKTDDIVSLGGSWVVNRRPMGRAALIVCNSPLRITEHIAKEIGSSRVFEINITNNGIKKNMHAMRVNCDIVCWNVN